MSNIISNSALDRRRFFKGAVIATAGLTGAALLFSASAAEAAIPSAIPGTGDLQVLNYALALEDLEADLYLQASLRLGAGGTDPQAASTVGAIVGLNVSGLDVTYINLFRPVEAAHRDFLKSALGAQAITTLKPAKYDFGIQNMTRQQVLDLVLEAEATGVQAYLGAIPCFTPKSPYLQTAAAIQGTEARHTSVLTVVRNLLSVQGIVTDPISPVAPLKGDNAQPTATNYDNAMPSKGTVEGRDAFLSPDQVLARVGGFIKYS